MKEEHWIMARTYGVVKVLGFAVNYYKCTTELTVEVKGKPEIIEFGYHDDDIAKLHDSYKTKEYMMDKYPEYFI